jgi:hypothetical protein
MKGRAGPYPCRLVSPGTLWSTSPAPPSPPPGTIAPHRDNSAAAAWNCRAHCSMCPAHSGCCVALPTSRAAIHPHHKADVAPCAPCSVTEAVSGDAQLLLGAVGRAVRAAEPIMVRHGNSGRGASLLSKEIPSPLFNVPSSLCLRCGPARTLPIVHVAPSLTLPLVRRIILTTSPSCAMCAVHCD